MDLPPSIRKAAIKFAQRVTGITRPVRSHTVHIEAFEECFKRMVELGMVKEEFVNGEEKSISNRTDG